MELAGLVYAEWCLNKNIQGADLMQSENLTASGWLAWSPWGTEHHSEKALVEMPASLKHRSLEAVWQNICALLYSKKPNPLHASSTQASTSTQPARHGQGRSWMAHRGSCSVGWSAFGRTFMSLHIEGGPLRGGKLSGDGKCSAKAGLSKLNDWFF